MGYVGLPACIVAFVAVVLRRDACRHAVVCHVVSCRCPGWLRCAVWFNAMVRRVRSCGNTRCDAVLCCLVSCLVGVFVCRFVFASCCVVQRRCTWPGVWLQLGAPRQDEPCRVVWCCGVGHCGVRGLLRCVLLCRVLFCGAVLCCVLSWRVTMCCVVLCRGALLCVALYGVLVVRC